MRVVYVAGSSCSSIVTSGEHPNDVALTSAVRSVLLMFSLVLCTATTLNSYARPNADRPDALVSQRYGCVTDQSGMSLAA